MYKGIQSYPFYRLVADMYTTSAETPRKHLILEPLSCVIRLILLHYKDRGTKISILDNGIRYNPPSFSQGLMRAWYRDNREDLHNLCSPLHYFKMWYPRCEPQYHALYAQCVRGVYVLRESYDKKTTIYHTLTHYSQILLSLPEESVDKEEDEEEEIVEIENDMRHNPLIEHLKHIWSPEEITLLTYLLALVEEDNESSPTYLKNLEDILSAKEENVHNYIKEMATSY